MHVYVASNATWYYVIIYAIFYSFKERSTRITQRSSHGNLHNVDKIDNGISYYTYIFFDLNLILLSLP